RVLFRSSRNWCYQVLWSAASRGGERHAQRPASPGGRRVGEPGCGAPAGRHSSSRRVSVQPFRGRSAPLAAIGVTALCVFTLGACDIPTEIPRWNTRWVIPAERTAFPVADLLPAGISVVEGGERFDLPLEAISLSRSLADICSACAPADGLTVPKPPFSVSFGGELEMPAEMLSA